ncbi:glycosyltransferase family 2 protein [Cellulomonas endophytica]|uniref:glycosyltransferase family 2 protein n=1 Tax=Cellulomonas endophytica TaxID=2494735 RepID=UPI0010131C44|nr:glycosyltransferase family 2 protein [Cellulomonas endophytica]
MTGTAPAPRTDGGAPGPDAPDLTGVAVVVVNYGSSDLLAENIPRCGLAGSGARVVVVDNRTTEAERERLLALGADQGWDVVPAATNLGFGGGMNVGVAHARAAGADVVLLLNPDAWLPPADLAALVDAARAEPTTLLSPEIVRPDGTPWFRGAWIDVPRGRTRTGTPPTPPEHPWLVGACLVLHTDLWERIGGFDERYFLYWEDVDVSWRVLAAGGALRVLGTATAVHSVGGTQRTEGKSPGYCYWNTRNRLLFAAQHLPRATVLRWALRTPFYAREVLLRGERTLDRRIVAPFWATARGSLAGLGLAVRALVLGPVPRG